MIELFIPIIAVAFALFSWKIIDVLVNWRSDD